MESVGSCPCLSACLPAALTHSMASNSLYHEKLLQTCGWPQLWLCTLYECRSTNALAFKNFSLHSLTRLWWAWQKEVESKLNHQFALCNLFHTSTFMMEVFPSKQYLSLILIMEETSTKLLKKKKTLHLSGLSNYLCWVQFPLPFHSLLCALKKAFKDFCEMSISALTAQQSKWSRSASSSWLMDRLTVITDNITEWRGSWKAKVFLYFNPFSVHTVVFG